MSQHVAHVITMRSPCSPLHPTAELDPTWGEIYPQNSAVFLGNPVGKYRSGLLGQCDSFILPFFLACT